MRIIGGKDYYDSALAFGRDETLVFVRSGDRKIHKDKFLVTEAYKQIHHSYNSYREHRFIVVNNKNKTERWYQGNGFSHKDKKYELIEETVYFCGKRYRGIKITCSDILGIHNTYFWNYDELLEYLATFGLKIRTTKRKASRYLRVDGKSSDETSREWFASQLTDAQQEWLIANRVTIATQHKDEWFIDGDGLKSLEFAKRLDPYTAMQELSMWVGNVLPKEENKSGHKVKKPPRPGSSVVEIVDDVVKRDKHGFDKFSFKKGPEK